MNSYENMPVYKSRNYEEEKPKFKPSNSEREDSVQTEEESFERGN